jgi:hypothetical protein
VQSAIATPPARCASPPLARTRQAPAGELAALFAQRWEFQSTLDEIKTHLGGSHLVLRSQHPDGAEH